MLQFLTVVIKSATDYDETGLADKN